jgi:hypothetical protein
MATRLQQRRLKELARVQATLGGRENFFLARRPNLCRFVAKFWQLIVKREYPILGFPCRHGEMRPLEDNQRD